MNTVGGYRLVRKLGSGARAEVFLGHLGHDAGTAPRTVAVKLFRVGVPAHSIDHEIEAIGAVASPHTLALLDLASSAGGIPCLILQRLDPGGLSRLLADRPSLDPGEVVTILAPIVAAIAQLHRVGWAHGSISTSKILFDHNGAPVLSGFGAAKPLAAISPTAQVTDALLDADAAVATDLADVTTLVRGVVSRARGAGTLAGAGELLAWLDADQHREHAAIYMEQLEKRVFDLGDAAPVQLSGALGTLTTQSQIPGRVGGALRMRERSVGRKVRAAAAEPPSTSSQRTDASDGESTRLPTWLSSLLPPWIARELAEHPRLHSIGSQIGRLRLALKAVRKRVWILAGVVLGLLAVALMVVPGPGSDVDPTDRADAAIPRSGLSAPSAEPEPDIPLETDDPVDALRVLLELREKCILDRSVLCLDGVDQANSAAWEADQHRIRLLQNGGEFVATEFSGNNLELIDRMGDSALIAVLPATPSSTVPKSSSASVLVVRTEAGWRIRDLLADPAA